MTIETNRTDLAQSRIIADVTVDLDDGDCRLRIEHFALTTNNVTYGVFGDMLRYWDVFPASDSSSEWGRIPTWGVAEVIETRSEFVAVGERLFGFLPMSAETIITPGKSDDRGVSDVAPHRIGLAGAYNRYQRASTDPIHHLDREPQQMVLYPLFFTSFVIDDFLADNNDFGALQVIVSSASSKTAIGFAYLAKRRGLKVSCSTKTSPQSIRLIPSTSTSPAIKTFSARCTNTSLDSFTIPWSLAIRIGTTPPHRRANSHHRTQSFSSPLRRSRSAPRTGDAMNSTDESDRRGMTIPIGATNGSNSLK